MTREAKLLRRAFFNRDPRIVARELLGKLIVRREGRKQLAGRIVEVDAYLGAGDLAAHAAAGHTARNAVLWGPPGHSYVYFIYGVHYCLNISCLPAGDAGCVLIRALEPVSGLREMAEARDLADLDLTLVRDLRKLASGPGKLCEALGITRPRDNDKDMLSPKSDIQVMSDGFRVQQVAVSQRIGITKAAELPLRYVIAGNTFVSKK
jgi:DNA-3-methyladenine glycosylase